jgi:hypothetical protein
MPRGHAILNGFGRTLGDGIIGLQALAAAIELGALSCPPALFRLPGLAPMVEAPYAAAADLAGVAVLPWAAATPAHPFGGAAGYARVTDLRDFAFDPAFRGVAMIDYFLGRLGLDPAAVPPALRRNAWLRPRLAPTIGARGYVLVCPRTNSPLRDMPDEVHAHLLAWLAGRAPALTQATLPPARGLAELCGLVAGARLVVSADTAMVHLADAMAVPCLAFFTTHRPEWRVRDYPLCRAVDLAAAVPAALEFARGAADIASCRAAWFAAGMDLAWLDAELEAMW